MYEWYFHVAQPQAQFNGFDHKSDSPSVHLFFVLPSIDFHRGRKESTRPSLRLLISTTTHPPPRPPATRPPVHLPIQPLLPQRTRATPQGSPGLAPARSTSPRTLFLRWQKSLVTLTLSAPPLPEPLPLPQPLSSITLGLT
ncbi:Steroid receptor-associated and regulated protein [Frankliniella fusca]|uniref:Steroid receptor-associated and regulated protein n=1 Tax=Frankliniella fusca TaxID=407009 RepID=A0AAE1LBZ5_9NEOP|nr:Steroid receptor-associated and regulated protein [Frankliniella fusca]